MLIKKISVSTFLVLFLFSILIVYVAAQLWNTSNNIEVNIADSDSKNTNPYVLKNDKFNISIEFYNYPLKLGEQFFDITIFHKETSDLYNGEAILYFNTPDKKKRYKVYALKLPNVDSIYKSTFTFKQSGLWVVELDLNENNITEKFYFDINIAEASIGAFRHGYLLMLSVPLLIFIAYILLLRESRRNKQ